MTAKAEAAHAKAEAHAAKLRPVVKEIMASGITSHFGIARELNLRGLSAPRGGAWRHVQVAALLRRLDGNRPMSVPRRNSAALRAHALAPLIAEIREGGAGTFEAIARQLNERGIETNAGKSWTGSAVRYVVLRLKNL